MPFLWRYRQNGIIEFGIFVNFLFDVESFDDDLELELKKYFIYSTTLTVAYRLYDTVTFNSNRRSARPTLNPHWQILESSSKFFSEILEFQYMPQTYFRKTDPFVQPINWISWVSIYFISNRVMSQTDFWKIHPYFVKGQNEFSRNCSDLKSRKV